MAAAMKPNQNIINLRAIKWLEIESDIKRWCKKHYGIDNHEDVASEGMLMFLQTFNVDGDYPRGKVCSFAHLKCREAARNLRITRRKLKTRSEESGNEGCEGSDSFQAEIATPRLSGPTFASYDEMLESGFDYSYDPTEQVHAKICLNQLLETMTPKIRAATLAVHVGATKTEAAQLIGVPTNYIQRCYDRIGFAHGRPRPEFGPKSEPMSLEETPMVNLNVNAIADEIIIVHEMAAKASCKPFTGHKQYTAMQLLMFENIDGNDESPSASENYKSRKTHKINGASEQMSFAF